MTTEIQTAEKSERVPQRFGYCRVSSSEQSIDRQLISLSAFQIPKRNLYIDRQSGKDFDRPAYKRLLKRVKKGDVMIVKSIDRLGRNYADLMEQWRIITKDKGVDIKVVDMPLLDTTYGKDLLGTFIADLTLQIMSLTAELERGNIHQRQAEGIAAAKARGVVFGKKAMEVPEGILEDARAWQEKRLSLEEAAAKYNISRSKVYQFFRCSLRDCEGLEKDF